MDDSLDSIFNDLDTGETEEKNLAAFLETMLGSLSFCLVSGKGPFCLTGRNFS